MREKLQQAASVLFEGDKIDLLIGHSQGTLPLRSRPEVFNNAEALVNLVWNSYCANNVAVYLPRYFAPPKPPRRGEVKLPRIGVVVKGCDDRSIVSLVKEKQVPRENITVIGVPCAGMVDVAKVSRAMGGESVVACEEQSDGALVVTSRVGQSQSFEKEQVLADACLDCEQPIAAGADITLEGEAREPSAERHKGIDEFATLAIEERWQHFKQEISKCIRCYACREACPNCYCEVCFADQTKPRWIGAGTELSDLMLYHIGRIFHQAGRCVECDACVRACPMGLDLRTFTQKLALDVKELFDFTPGLSPDEPVPLCTFKDDDDQGFITEP